MNGFEKNCDLFQGFRLGLFIHYFYFDNDRDYLWGKCRRPDGTVSGSVDDIADGLDVAGIADAAQAMAAEYVIITAWHANMNPLFPCESMDKWRPGHCSKRDVISELYDALEPLGIKLILYVHPSDGMDFCDADQEKTGWNAKGDYSRWNDFINEVFEETVNRYAGRVLGYWVDGGLPDQVDQSIGRLRNTIRAADANAVVIQNDGTAQNHFRRWADFTCREIIDFPFYSEAMQAATKITTEWWAVHGCLQYWTPEFAFQYLVLQSATLGNTGGIAYATGPFVGGGWEPGLEEFFNNLGKYVREYGESIIDTVPSQSLITSPRTPLGGETPAKVVATESKDSAKTYVHILSSPETKTLVLPLPVDGKEFSTAYTLIGSHPVKMDCGPLNLRLTLPDHCGWDAMDTVIVLE